MSFSTHFKFDFWPKLFPHVAQTKFLAGTGAMEAEWELKKFHQNFKFKNKSKIQVIHSVIQCHVPAKKIN